MISVAGKKALITGASRGIGREIAIALADAGCHLVLHSRKMEHTLALAEQLASNAIDIEHIAADLGSTDEMIDMIDRCVSLPDIDILYNNAAIMPAWDEDVWDTDPDILRQSFEVNVVSQIRLCNALIPTMLERGFGRIINLVSGIDRLPNLAAYAITKAALQKYTHDITPALVDTGVIMNSLDPGWCRTDMGSSEAPNDVTTVIPGALVPALIDADVNGARFDAQLYAGMTIDSAVKLAEETLRKEHEQ